jgi:hypothetical protein
MPIPREQFDKGLSERQMRIIKFLEEHPTEAFESEEILRLESAPPTDFLEKMNVSLELGRELFMLVLRGLIERKDVGAKTYYAAKRQRA